MKGRANQIVPESCASHREVLWRSVDRGVDGPSIEPRKRFSPGCRRCLCSGRQHEGVRYRECPCGPAWSETLARQRNLLSGNREISRLAVAERAARSGKAGGLKPVMHGGEKSGPSIVAVKPANEGGATAGGVGGAKGRGRGEHDWARQAPDSEPGTPVPRARSCTASSEGP